MGQIELQELRKWAIEQAVKSSCPPHEVRSFADKLLQYVSAR